MKIKTYNYILNTLLKVSPFFANSVLDESIRKSGHSIDSISAGEMLKILQSQVIPRLSKDRLFLTDPLTIANTCIIQTDENNQVLHFEGTLNCIVSQEHDFDYLYKLGFVKKIQDTATTTIREVQIAENHYKINISPVFNKQMTIVGTISSITNLNLQREIELEILSYSENLRKEIDARLLAEDELKENQSVLFHSSKLVALGEMASGIAHEINNPLASLKLSIDLLKRLKQKEKLTDDKIDTILKSQLELIDRIRNTIDSMKKLSRPTGRDEGLQEVSLKSIIKDVIGICMEKFVLNDVEIKFDETKKDISILAHETQIGQVLINLINNAFEEIYDQYQDPWIEIDWRESGDFYFITVTDCGLGIPLDKADKIFNPFFSGKIEQGGTGLGLSISSQIIKTHHGDLYLDLEYPNTRFVISLPNNKGLSND